MSLLAFRATLVHSGNSNTAGTRKLVRALSSITAVTWTSKKKKKKKKKRDFNGPPVQLGRLSF